MKTGARGLKKIMEAVLQDIMYSFDEHKNKTFKITSEYVNKMLRQKKAA